MISVLPEEEGEDVNMESYGEEGYEEGYEGEYTDTEEEEAPPEYTTADEGFQGEEGDSNGIHQGPPLNIGPRTPWKRQSRQGNWW